MIKFFIDFIQFLNSTAPLLTSLAIFTLLAVLLSKSIKKHATIYYIVLAIPFAMVAIPFVCRLFGIEMFSFSQIPFLGGILRDYIHFGTFAFPILIIVMYAGALNPGILWVKKLLKIRKELSIISGFPVLTHALIRVTGTFPNSLRYFTNNAEYMANTNVTNELGAGISNFSFVLGIVLLVLFIPLWVTSFDSIHKRMGNVKWKRLQKWSYPFYALLFIHAMGIQVGGMLNPRGGSRPAQAVEVSANTETNRRTDNKTATIITPQHTGQGKSLTVERRDNHHETGNQSGGSLTVRNQENGNRTIENHANKSYAKHAKQMNDSISNSRESGRDQGKIVSSGRDGHARSIGFTDINVSREVKRYIHIASLILIFGLYLYLRLRKAKKDAARRRTK
ncbi:ferric reductase-like transmembrane domain-containing protein [Proteiniphilum acetatigenes]|uniref:ferric reductase-like transmembrane domain-containing protein n=1 Tax=Proteiniphilum acetatigenes TaxID=294710 RepID=UPI000378353B|nr:ferric reductase-like transmembrane domain-containing protein [Proteiniphilum acetatigenes]SFK56956.1 Ferric reductase like transmembrane component [Porphyromonadaceae bacterium KH3CP3RA]